jgi:hypothetical protein
MYDILLSDYFNVVYKDGVELQQQDGVISVYTTLLQTTTTKTTRTKTKS